MHFRWTRYRFVRPEHWSDASFLLARLYPRAFLVERWREIEGDVLVNAGRILLALVLVIAGKRASSGWLDDISPILAYPLVLGGVALFASCTLSALSYLAYLVQAGAFWIGFVLTARRFDDAEQFRLAFSGHQGAAPERAIIRASQSLLASTAVNAKRPTQSQKLMLAGLMIVGVVLIARAGVSTSYTRRVVASTSTGTNGLASGGQMPVASRGVVSEEGLTGHGAPNPETANRAAGLDTARRSSPQPAGSTVSPPFKLDDLLGPERVATRPSAANDVSAHSSPSGAEAKPGSRNHAPEPAALVASGADDIALGVALRRGIDQTFAEAIDLLSDYRLNHSIRFRARDCGDSRSVSYEPSTYSVVLCIQFVVHAYTVARDEGSGDPVDVARDVARFAIAHEIGHALIHTYRLPVLGREEDAADQFAAFLFLEHGRPIPVLAAAENFSASDPSSGVDPEALGDEHSLDHQRVANLACWLYGSAPAEHTTIAGILPTSRRERCKREFAQLRTSWVRLLRPHVRD